MALVPKTNVSYQSKENPPKMVTRCALRFWGFGFRVHGSLNLGFRA